jgi:cell division protein FtsB
MVTRTRVRAVLTAIGLYVGAALLIGYFGINAYTGAHGLKAKQDLMQQISELTGELDRLKRERADWDHRVSLLRADGLDRDLLDERARVMLDYMDSREITLMLKPRAAAGSPSDSR